MDITEARQQAAVAGALGVQRMFGPQGLDHAPISTCSRIIDHEVALPLRALRRIGATGGIGRARNFGLMDYSRTSPV